jgi:hypothetical protein
VKQQSPNPVAHSLTVDPTLAVASVSTATKRCAVTTQLWEWAVQREIRNSPVGLSGTEDAAMTALSKSLLAAGRPARGQVSRVTLVRPVHKDSSYEREPPKRLAVFDGSVITWISPQQG